MSKMKFNILNRFSMAVQATVKIPFADDVLESGKLGLAVLVALKSGADLGGADLRGANLGGADLRGAYLGDADLGGANLGGADLGDADLGGANLGGADLGGANLGGANLGGADLRGAKWTKDVIINLAPIFIGNLAWDVWILDDHMQIGCKFHSLKDWASFDDRRIAQMGNSAAVKFWRANKDWLLAAAKANGRGVGAEKAA